MPYCVLLISCSACVDTVDMSICNYSATQMLSYILSFFNREHGVVSLEAEHLCGRKINVIMIMATLRMNLEKVPDDEPH